MGSGSSPSLGAGVHGMLKANAYGEIKGRLSAPGRAVLWGGLESVSALAQGDPHMALGIAAAGVLAGTAYLAARALAPEITKAVVIKATAKQLTDGVGDLIPMWGAIISASIEYGGSATAKSDEAILDQCRREYKFVDETLGTGPNNEILPSDLFMGETKSDFGEKFADALSEKHAGKVRNHSRGNFGAFLRLLEERPPSSVTVGGDVAKALWPRAGLTPKEREVLRYLRLGMSAAYKNAVTGKQWTKEPTDGGVTLWPLYADILTNAWRDERLPSGWLSWRLIADGPDCSQKLARLYVNAARTPFLYGNVPPRQAVRDAVRAGYDSGKPLGDCCVAWDGREIAQLETMVRGWWNLTHSMYTQFQQPNFQPVTSTGKGLPSLTFGALNRTTTPARPGSGGVVAPALTIGSLALLAWRLLTR